MHLRRKLVAGNWKMNGSLAALAELGPIAEAARGAGGIRCAAGFRDAGARPSRPAAVIPDLIRDP